MPHALPPARHLAGLLAVAALLASSAAAPARAAEPPQLHQVPVRGQLVRAPGPLSPAPSSASGSRARLSRAHVTRAATSSWSVHYSGSIPAGAATAFQAAVDTWSGLVTSAVPIVVNVDFKDLGPGVLGSAGPAAFLTNDDDGDGKPDTAYPVALLNAKKGRDLDPSQPDILASFTNTDPAIYYGTDGNPPAGQIDFETVVLHELGHGLGFLGLMDVVNGVGSWDASDNPPFPAIYDRFTAQGTTPLLAYTNGSQPLAAALTSDAVTWAGPLAVAAYCGVHPQLYAPGTWEDASSYAHLSPQAFPQGDPNALMTPSLAAGVAIHDPGPVVLGMFADMGWQTPVSSCSSRYTPLDPVRLLDTRTSSRPRLDAGGFLDLQVAGRAGVPTDALAVVLNVTGTGPTSGTDIRAYPTPGDGGVPVVSNLNLRAGETRANLVTVALGSQGRVRLRNSAGSVALIADLAGYYSPSGSSAYHPITPVRVLDTFTGPGQQRIGPGGVIDVPVAGANGVPATATAVAVTVTAVGASSGTDVRAYPTPAGGEAPPTVSNLNLTPGPPVPNMAVVKVGASGSIRLRNAAGDLALIVDLEGWYDPSAQGALFRALAPRRVLDTRPSRVGPGGNVDIVVAGQGPVPAGAVAVVLNVTGVAAGGGTDVRVYPVPTDGSFPEVSNLNLDAGQTNADLAQVSVGDGGAVRLRNSGAQLALLADLSGWFGP